MYYLEKSIRFIDESIWQNRKIVPEGMNYEMLEDMDRHDLLLKPGIDLIGKNKTFVDLGCGTGLLGLYALSKGAKFVYFVEKDLQMIKILHNVLPKKIKNKKRYKIIESDIESLKLEDFDKHTPEVVVSEFYGPSLFDEGYVEYCNKLRECFPKIYFIPETFKISVYASDVVYGEYPWPVNNTEVVEDFKYMYKEKGFNSSNGGGWREPTLSNEVLLGEIIFNANTNEFNGELILDLNFDKSIMIKCLPTVHHLGFPHKNTAYFGWYVDKEDMPAKYKFYVSPENFYNPIFEKIDTHLK
jgi:16S rRNA G966 N2-methylase RsmD